MLTHPTHERLIALGLTGMAKALEEQRKQPDIAALSFEERGRIVEALTVAPAALVGIRTELAAQLKRHKEHAEKLERTKRYREIEERRAARADRPLDQPV